MMTTVVDGKGRQNVKGNLYFSLFLGFHSVSLSIYSIQFSYPVFFLAPLQNHFYIHVLHRHTRSHANQHKKFVKVRRYLHKDTIAHRYKYLRSNLRESTSILKDNLLYLITQSGFPLSHHIYFIVTTRIYRREN